MASRANRPPFSDDSSWAVDTDAIALEENPLEDVRVLQKSGNVRWVWRGGRVFKGKNYEMGDEVGLI